MTYINSGVTTNSPVGQMDVDQDWVDLNPQSGGYLDAPVPNVQNGIIPTAPQDTSVNGVWNIPYGSWRKVPDDSVTITKTNIPFGTLFIAQQGIWRLPNGTEIALSEDEMRYTPTFSLSFSQQAFTDMSVKVTKNTMPGMVAFGLVQSAVEGDESIATGGESPPASLTQTQNQVAGITGGLTDVIGSSTKTLIIVAGVGILIYLMLKKKKLA